MAALRPRPRDRRVAAADAGGEGAGPDHRAQPLAPDDDAGRAQRGQPAAARPLPARPRDRCSSTLDTRNPGFPGWLIDDDLKVRGGSRMQPDGGVARDAPRGETGRRVAAAARDPAGRRDDHRAGGVQPRGRRALPADLDRRQRHPAGPARLAGRHHIDRRRGPAVRRRRRCGLHPETREPQAVVFDEERTRDRRARPGDRTRPRGAARPRRRRAGREPVRPGRQPLARLGVPVGRADALLRVRPRRRASRRTSSRTRTRSTTTSWRRWSRSRSPRGTG